MLLQLANEGLEENASFEQGIEEEKLSATITEEKQQPDNSIQLGLIDAEQPVLNQVDIENNENAD